MNKRNIKNTFFYTLSLLALFLLAPQTQAYLNLSTSQGFVAAVGIETDSSGKPMLAEYDSKGSFIDDIGFLGAEPFIDVTTMSAVTYRAFVQFHNDYKAANPERTRGARVLPREQYEALGLTKADGTPITLAQANTKSVYITSEQNLLINVPSYDSVILQEYPIDMSNPITLPSGINSLLIDNEGHVQFQSRFDISYKAAIFKNDDESDDLLAPLEGVFVEAAASFGVDFTDNTGHYSVPVLLPPCPGFNFFFQVPIIAYVPTANFNPKGNNNQINSIISVQRTGKACIGLSDRPVGATLQAQMARIAVIGIEARSTIPRPPDINHYITTMQLNAKGTIENVNLGVTQYEGVGNNALLKAGNDQSIANENAGDYQFDFDSDGNTDIVVPTPGNPGRVDIYLNGNPIFDELGTRNPPDISRLADYELTPQLDNQGLLKSISIEDLEDTDIYVYRVSTGQLIMTLEGLNTMQNQESPLVFSGVFLEAPIATFGFSQLLIGAKGTDFISASRGINDDRGSPWSTGDRSATDFTDGDRSAVIAEGDATPDILRPGEQVKIIAINRATGYIGSKTLRLQSVYNTPVDAIKMGPPNLKIIATRTYQDQAGLSKDEIHDNQLIGSEGAGLTSDRYVKIQTVWLEKDGTPLPESLPGYTGRLAISTGSATEDFSGNFAIKPGYQTEFIQLNNNVDLTTEHFYVQVIGENTDGNPSFESPGAGSGPLLTRPAKYTPILVPIFDELSTITAQNALRDARKQGIQNLPDEAEPVYHWVYRPEMQFSVYDLTVRDIKLEGGANNAFNQSIIKLTNPVIGADTVVDVFLTLNSPENDALPFFGPGQDLILKIGENEYSIQTNAAGEQTFIEINSDHFTNLAVDDFLTISIFLNNDSANTLWQFGFTTLDVDVDSDNNNGLGLPDRSPEEELVEDIQGEPGKTLIANIDDTDGDGIPDFADYDAGAGFAPMIIEVPRDIDISTAKLRFTYEQSDPNNITIDTSGEADVYIPDNGYQRIWIKNGTLLRNTSDINGGGDFIRKNTLYELNLFGLTETKRDVVVYVELVTEDVMSENLLIKVELIE